MLLTAIIRIKTEKPNLLADWHIDIVGWNHENCQAELERIVHEGHLEEQVTFHGGLFGDDKLRMYATSDAYILPSHGEGLPMTILEAWSWKLPVVMTSKCNIPEGFEANAALRIDDTIESVKQGLIKLLSMNPEQRKNIGVNGYQLVKEKFTWDASAKKMIQYMLGYLEMLQNQVSYSNRLVFNLMDLQKKAPGHVSLGVKIKRAVWNVIALYFSVRSSRECSGYGVSHY